jgi:peptide/nickel transport system substrate-binding protein
MTLARLRFALPSITALVAALALHGAPAAAAGGTLTWGKQAEVLSFNPQRSGDGTSWDLFYLVYEQLLTTDDEGHLAPSLAERWEQLSPLSYRFHLRPGAGFSNGRPVVADDVVGSLKRMIDPKTIGPWGKQLGDITAIVAEDDRTVRVDFGMPNPAFLALMAISPFSIVPIKEIEDGSFDITKGLLGSGPFMVTEHLQDQSWTLARNPHYGRGDRPALDGFVIRVMPNEAARIAALRSGQIDVATFDSADTPALLRGIKGVKLTKQATPNYYRLDVNAVQDSSPMKDLRVRQAMHYALDREAIARIVFGGESHPETPIPLALANGACGTDPFYTLPRAERLARARALLKEAGKEGVEVGVIGAAALSTYSLIAQTVQSSLNEAGFKAHVEKIQTAEWYQRVFVKEPKFDIAVSWYAGFGDPAIVLHWWTPDGMKGWADGYTVPDDRLTAAIGQIRTLDNGPARTAALGEACRLIDEDSNVIALVDKPDYVAYRDDLVDVRFAPREANFRMFKYADSFARRK